MADKKQRFSLMEENGELYIRANQGHSLKVYGFLYKYIVFFSFISYFPRVRIYISSEETYWTFTITSVML